MLVPLMLAKWIESCGAGRSAARKLGSREAASRSVLSSRNQRGQPGPRGVCESHFAWRGTRGSHRAGCICGDMWEGSPGWMKFLDSSAVPCRNAIVGRVYLVEELEMSGWCVGCIEGAECLRRSGLDPAGDQSLRGFGWARVPYRRRRAKPSSRHDLPPSSAGLEALGRGGGVACRSPGRRTIPYVDVGVCIRLDFHRAPRPTANWRAAPTTVSYFCLHPRPWPEQPFC